MPKPSQEGRLIRHKQRLTIATLIEPEPWGETGLKWRCPFCAEDHRYVTAFSRDRLDERVRHHLRRIHA